MTREEIIEKVQKLAKGWYWTADVTSTFRNLNSDKVTYFKFSSTNVEAIDGFEAFLINDKPYTLLERINFAILDLQQKANDIENEEKAEKLYRDIDEIEGLAQILEDAFYENYETGKDPSELIEVKYIKVEDKCNEKVD